MDTEEYGRRERVAYEKSQALAKDKVDGLNLPQRASVNMRAIRKLGTKFNDKATRIESALADAYGEQLGRVHALARRHLWLGLWKGVYYFHEAIRMGIMQESPYTKRFLTVEGYAKWEGRASAAHGSISRPESLDELIRLRVKDATVGEPSATDLLDALALHFMVEASNAIQRGQIHEGLDWLFEVTDALSYATGDYMWAAGAESTSNVANDEALSSLARAGAYARHLPNRQSKEKVFKWCDENLSRYPSMDAAAFDIAETFIPQKFRTVRDWMTEWKKVRGAGRP